jgi:hypothetical protein
VGEVAVKVEYFNKYIIESCVDNHLRYLLGFKTASGKTAWRDGVIEFFNRGTADEFLDAVMRHQTDFVKNNLQFFEIAIPNRDAYGHIARGYIKDTVFVSGVK